MKVETIYSRAGVEIVTSPFLVGPELEKLAQQASCDFIRALPEDVTDVVSLEILNGGHYYFVGPAFEEVRGVKCPISTLRAKRRLEDGEWKVRVWDEGGEDLSNYSALLIGDTVATGTTLCGTIKVVLERIAAAGRPLPDVYVWTIAGASSVVGHPTLQEIDETLRGHGRELSFYFANARFNLAPNGTDLRLVDAEYDKRAEHEITAKVGAFLPKMRCAVWDWGDRFREVRNHLEEIAEYYAAEGAPEWLLEGIQTRRLEQGDSVTAGMKAAEAPGEALDLKRKRTQAECTLADRAQATEEQGDAPEPKRRREEASVN